MTEDLSDYRFEYTVDAPKSGMWHCGPNSGWVTVTHIPTMISARAYGLQQFKMRNSALACCQMLVEESRATHCGFPENLNDTDAPP